jgi:hypothetical protein
LKKQQGQLLALPLVARQGRQQARLLSVQHKAIGGLALSSMALVDISAAAQPLMSGLV